MVFGILTIKFERRVEDLGGSMQEGRDTRLVTTAAPPPLNRHFLIRYTYFARRPSSSLAIMLHRCSSQPAYRNVRLPAALGNSQQNATQVQ
jgi:hypothetical protein